MPFSEGGSPTRPELTLTEAAVNLIENLVMHNFYLTELLGGFLYPVEHPEAEWVYAYSQNKTLLSMSLDKLRQLKPEPRIHYL